MKESRFVVFIFLLIVWVLLMVINLKYGEGREYEKKEVSTYSLGMGSEKDYFAMVFK